MAKDGTARGGARKSSGRKKKPLADKILEGKAESDFPVGKLPEPGEMESCEVPDVEDYMTAEQYEGNFEIRAKKVFENTWRYLAKFDCAERVNKELLNEYAMTVARWIQCEMALSKYGLLANHPTTGEPMASPFVAMEREYLKQINNLWYQIYQVVRENSERTASDRDDKMEELLSRA